MQRPQLDNVIGKPIMRGYLSLSLSLSIPRVGRETHKLGTLRLQYFFIM